MTEMGPIGDLGRTLSHKIFEQSQSKKKQSKMASTIYANSGGKNMRRSWRKTLTRVLRPTSILASSSEALLPTKRIV